MSGGFITGISVNALRISAMVPFVSVSLMKPVDWTALSSDVLLVERAAQWLEAWLKMRFVVNAHGWVVKKNIMILYLVLHNYECFSVELLMFTFP